MNTELIAAVCCGAIFALMITVIAVRAVKKKKFAPAGVFCIIGALLSGFGTAAMGYFSVYYHALPSAREQLQSGGGVTVSETDEGWFFDGKGEDCAIIFFQGGKVESASYAPLMHRLAEEGIDCFLIDAPLNFPMLGFGKADAILAENNYSDYYIAGHSLGGVAASAYVSSRTDKTEGLILLASFPASQLGDPLRVLSIYGTNDGCLNFEKYREALSKMPSSFEELEIEGGNHAQFGDYGAQQGDGTPSVSPEEQLSITAERIKEFAGA